MKRLAFIGFLVLGTAFKADGQNLVPNNSFETLNNCPSILGEIYQATSWFQPCTTNGSVYNSSSSDCYNSCSGIVVGVPNNVGGYQQPRTGLGYAGILFYEPGDFREYVEIKLSDSLLLGKRYCVSFYVALAELSGYGIDKIGAYFSNDSLLVNNYLFINVIPQIENNNIITDTTNWSLISGSFIAQGGEKFITIGNFNNNLNTQTAQITNPPGVYSYYFIDDVWVIECDTIPADTLSIPNVFTPNYDGVNDLFEIKGLQKGDKVQIYNRWGTLVFETESEKMFWDGYTTSGEPCSSGVYYYTVTLMSGETRKGYVTLIK